MRLTSLAAALAAIAFASPAAALERSVDDRGQVLIYPYYSARDGNVTLLTVRNTLPRSSAVRVRYREAYNGAEVLAFNLYLGPHDTWTGALAAVDADGPAHLVTRDTSCTIPASIATSSTPLRDFGYTGANRDYGDIGDAARRDKLGSPMRTREGFIEVFEMGTLGAPLQQPSPFTMPAGHEFRDCSVFHAAWQGIWSTNPAYHIQLPEGGLTGHAQIVNLARGTMFGVDAVALDDFHTDFNDPGALHRSPASGAPTLADARGADGHLDVSFDTFQGPRSERYPSAVSTDPVSLVLMHDAITGPWGRDPALGQSTEWVVTFPTKRQPPGGAPATPFSPFAPTGFSTEGPLVKLKSAEGATLLTGNSPDPSFGNTVNVVPISRTAPGGSTLLHAEIGGTVTWRMVDADPAKPVEGTLELEFPGDAPFIAPSGRRYRGLPVIGFAATVYRVDAGTAADVHDYTSASVLRGEPPFEY